MKSIVTIAERKIGINEDKASNSAKVYDKYDMASFFIAGVEFAEQWIIVSDEPPPINELVNVRNDECTPPYSYAIYHGNGIWQNPYTDKLTEPRPTHWKPVNR